MAIHYYVNSKTVAVSKEPEGTHLAHPNIVLKLIQRERQGSALLGRINIGVMFQRAVSISPPRQDSVMGIIPLQEGQPYLQRATNLSSPSAYC